MGDDPTGGIKGHFISPPHFLARIRDSIFRKCHPGGRERPSRPPPGKRGPDSVFTVPRTHSGACRKRLGRSPPQIFGRLRSSVARVCACARVCVFMCVRVCVRMALYWVKMGPKWSQYRFTLRKTFQNGSNSVNIGPQAAGRVPLWH